MTDATPPNREAAPWLVVVDAQTIFADPSSPWAAARFGAAADIAGSLVGRFDGRVVLTRFVAPARPEGAWVPYYAQFPFALVDGDPLYALVDPFAALEHPVLTLPTFGKWGPELAELTGGAPLVLTGVSTDCCVLSTALAAADAGVGVTVVADACAGATDADHDRALDVMRSYAPLLEVVRSRDLVV